MATLTIPSNADGTIFDPSLNAIIASAISAVPFGFDDVYVYAHGWSTDAEQASVAYDVFSIGLMRRLLVEQQQSGPLPSPAKSTLEMGIHWPSEITEDPNSPLSGAQLFTFFTMKQRADAVGRNLVYSVLRLALAARQNQPLRFFVIGHSFGCKVVCAALNDIQADLGATIPVSPLTSWRVALLEAATDQDNLERNDIYGNIGKLNNLRLLLTTSKLDLALTKWYPRASAIANFFHGAAPTPALGAAGPSSGTVAYFGGVTNLAVDIGFTMSTAVAATGQLVVADLTAAHEARSEGAPPIYSGGVAGSHSDIFFDEIYNLVGGFFYS
jgi:hypothetical protein